MLKTLKRKIALVAVAGLGFGLMSTVPAFAGVSDAVDIGFTVDAIGIQDTNDVTVAKTTTNTTSESRVGATLTVHSIAPTAGETGYAANTSKYRAVLTCGITVTNGNWVVAKADDSTQSDVVIPQACGTAGTADLQVQVDNDGDLDTSGAADRYITSAKNVVTVVNAGTPTYASWVTTSITQLSANGADRNIAIYARDASGVKTLLLDTETIAVDISPVTGATATQVGIKSAAGADGATSYSVPVGAAAQSSVDYNVTINGDGTGNGVTGTTIPGTNYTLTAQLLRGTGAVGAPASLTYKRLSNTASLAGTVSFVDGTVTTTAVTAISAANGQAASGFKIKAVDANGGLIQGATVTLSVSGITGAFTNNNQLSGTDGLTGTAMVFTPSSAGSGTITATITTGLTSITASVPVTSSAYGTKAATAAGTTTVNVNGTGWSVDGVGAFTGSLNITKISTTITGLTPNSAVLLAVTPPNGGAATSDVGLNPTANSDGTVVAVWTITSVDAGDTLVVTADGDGAAGAGVAVTVATVTFAAAQAAITTNPADGTSTYAAPSATVAVVATIANQFGASVPGGVVVFTNTVKPAAATAQTAATVAVAADGTAKFNAVLGSAAGTYTYTANAKTVDGANISNTASEHTSTFSFIVNAAGAPSAITVTGGANTALTEFRVLVDADGSWNLTGGAAAAKSKALTTNLAADAAAYTTMTVSVGAAGVIVNAKPGNGVLINSASATPVLYSSFNGATDLAVASNASGVATFYVTTTKPGVNTVEFSVGSVKTTAEFKGVLNNQLDDPAAAATARTVTLDKSTATVAGNIVQITATVKDIWGNAVPGVALTGAITGAAGRFSGGARTQAAVNTDANGQVVFEITSNGTETGTGTLTVAGTEAAAAANFLTGDLTANGAATIFTKASTKSATAALTIAAGSTVGAATETAINNVKSDVKAVSDTVATLSKAVTTVQSSVTELTSSFATQIKSLTDAIAKISRAIAAIQKSLKKK